MADSIDLFPQTKIRTVISASRRTDMVATDPDSLVHALEKNASSETHTVVLWTKNPANILHHTRLHSQLAKYDQCFIHLTITGLGNTQLEPRVPPPCDVFALLPELIRFVKSPDRIHIRFDPIVHFILKDGSSLCNLDFFRELAPHLQQHSIKNVITSWVHIYGKVAKRLALHGIQAQDLDHATLKREIEWLHKVATQHELSLYGCCVPDLPRSKCIDGELLTRLHPHGYKATIARATGQRLLCGCTKSKDIGWYTPCIHGCLYCYGHPKKYNA